MIKVKAGQLMTVLNDSKAYSYEGSIILYPKNDDPVVVLEDIIPFEGTSIKCLWDEKIVAIPYYCLRGLK